MTLDPPVAPPPRPWRASVRLRISTAFSLLALMTFIVIAGVSSDAVRRATELEARQALQQTAARVAHDLERGLADRRRDVQQLARLDLLSGEGLSPERWRVLLDGVRESFPSYTWIGVATPGGEVIAATGGLLEGRSVAQRPWFVEGLQASFVSDVHEARLLSTLLPARPAGDPWRLIDFSVPLRRGGVTHAVLGAHLSWDWVEARRRDALSTLEAAREAQIRVLDSRGLALDGPVPEPAVPAHAAALDALAAGEAWLREADGERWLAAMSAVPIDHDTRWVVLVQQPERTVFAGALQLRRQLWLAGIAAAAVFGLLAWWLAGRLTAPLRALAAGTRAILPPQSPDDEVTHVAAALRELVDRLRRRDLELTSLNATLEARVAERTESLRLVNEELEAYGRSVAHDLKGPLAMTALLLRQLSQREGERLADRGRRELSAAADECQRLAQLTGDLLTLSMADQQTLQPGRVDMRALVASVLHELGAGRAGLQVEIGALPEAAGDPTMLRQVWLNLLSNAYKYTGTTARPRIEIGGRRVDGECQYWVRDNGVGFDPAQASRLFGVFERLHPVSQFPGTGVGLSIVKRVLHRHGGRVWAASGDAGGACFGFALPVGHRPDPDWRSSDPESNPSGSTCPESAHPGSAHPGPTHPGSTAPDADLPTHRAAPSPRATAASAEGQG